MCSRNAYVFPSDLRLAEELLNQIRLQPHKAGVGEDGVPAFTRNGIENLRQIIADERAGGRAPPPVKSAK
jgi:hypothetical protein